MNTLPPQCPDPLDPEWLRIAAKELGVSEKRGGENPRILEYLRAIPRLADFPGLEDEIPWCAAFVGWCLAQAGLKGSDSALARSYESWGVEAEAPTRGDIVVMWRGNPLATTGHVGFYLGDIGDFVIVLAGNQGDAVSVSLFPKGRVLGYRRPGGADD